MCVKIVIFCCFISSIFSNSLLDIKFKNYKVVSKIDNNLWNSWLKKNVSATGFVNYQQGSLQKTLVLHYLKYLLQIDGEQIRPKKEQLAYYINLYNALVVYGVLKYYPIKGVFQIKNVSFFKLSFYLKNKKITIDRLEKEVILPKFKNPLVHFALNCASYSCPILLNQAYNRKNISSLLIKNTQIYLQDKRFAKLDTKKKILHLVELFQWYKKDFPNIKKFYKKYANVTLNLNNYSISYIPYRWSLNGK